MSELLLSQQINTPSKDANNETDKVLMIKRKIEKYIISFTALHKQSNITSDLSKLQGYCDKLQKHNSDSVWIVK